MSLNIGGSGVYRDIVKYNAQVGRWYLKSGDEENEIETPTMAMDLANIATGWVLFLEGSAPNRRMDASLDVPAPQPSESHKRGFMVLCYSTKYFNGVAELSSGSLHISNRSTSSTRSSRKCVVITRARSRLSRAPERRR